MLWNKNVAPNSVRAKKTTSWAMAAPAKAKHQSTDFNATKYRAPSNIVQLLKRKSELQWYCFYQNLW